MLCLPKVLDGVTFVITALVKWSEMMGIDTVEIGLGKTEEEWQILR